MVKRFKDWPKRLSAFLMENADKKFSYGEHDCMLFASKAVYAITGSDFSFEYPPYSTKEEAYEIIDMNGGMSGLIKKHLGKPLDNKLKAMRGDVCLIKAPKLMAGIVDDSGQRVAIPSENGLIRKSISETSYVWRV